MQNTVEYTGANKRVLPATVELLMRERNRSKSLRQLGQMFNRSHESIRQVLAKYDPPQLTLLTEQRVAAKLGYPLQWLIRDQIPGFSDRYINFPLSDLVAALGRYSPPY